MPRINPPVGQDPRERADAVRRLQEQNRQKKNMLDRIAEDMKRQQGGLSKRNQAIFDD